MAFCFGDVCEHQTVTPGEGEGVLLASVSQARLPLSPNGQGKLAQNVTELVWRNSLE